MTKNKYRNESELVEAYFSSIYLTIIALIQGIALGLLLIQGIEDGKSDLLCSKLTQYIFTGLIILAIWHHYMYGVVFTKWFPTLLDSLIPFALGTSEILMVTAAGTQDRTMWFLFTLCVTFFGAMSYLHSAWRMDYRFLLERLSESNARRHVSRMRILHNFAGAFVIVLGGITWLCMLDKISIWFMPIGVAVHIAAYEMFLLLAISPPFRRGLREN